MIGRENLFPTIPMKNKVLILTRDQEEFENAIRAFELPELQIFAPKTEAEIEKLIPEANIFLGVPPLAQKYVNQATRLKWMQSTFSGIDALVDDKLRSDYILTNVKDTYGEIMSEYVLAYILMFEKEILENIAHQRQKQWNQKPYRTLAEKTLGVMGTGSIGKQIGKVAKHLGMKTLGFRTNAGAVEHFDSTYTKNTLPEFLANSDYVVSILPKTPETMQLINKDTFRLMKTSAVFISIGRGDNVCEADLVTALRTQEIKAAVLDVFQEEPLPEKHVLWTLPNAYITPHVSGYYNSDKIYEIFRDNYLRFLKGEELLHRVDFEKGY
jgi:phosphoglycerate dehydrogenase-like enzyme